MKKYMLSKSDCKISDLFLKCKGLGELFYHFSFVNYLWLLTAKPLHTHEDRKIPHRIDRR